MFVSKEYANSDNCRMEFQFALKVGSIGVSFLKGGRFQFIELIVPFCLQKNPVAKTAYLLLARTTRQIGSTKIISFSCCGAFAFGKTTDRLLSQYSMTSVSNMFAMTMA